MLLKEAIELRKLKGSATRSYPWLILPCRILREETSLRNYVVVYNTNADDLDDMSWMDLNLHPCERIPAYARDSDCYAKTWDSLIAKCKDSDRWQAWTFDELYRFNCQDLINDPDVPRGLIINNMELYGI